MSRPMSRVTAILLTFNKAPTTKGNIMHKNEMKSTPKHRRARMVGAGLAVALGDSNWRSPDRRGWAGVRQRMPQQPTGLCPQAPQPATPAAPGQHHQRRAGSGLGRRHRNHPRHFPPGRHQCHLRGAGGDLQRQRHHHHDRPGRSANRSLGT